MLRAVKADADVSAELGRGSVGSPARAADTRPGGRARCDRAGAVAKRQRRYHLPPIVGSLIGRPRLRDTFAAAREAARTPAYTA